MSPSRRALPSVVGPAWLLAPLLAVGFASPAAATTVEVPLPGALLGTFESESRNASVEVNEELAAIGEVEIHLAGTVSPGTVSCDGFGVDECPGDPRFLPRIEAAFDAGDTENLPFVSLSLAEEAPLSGGTFSVEGAFRRLTATGPQPVDWTFLETEPGVLGIGISGLSLPSGIEIHSAIPPRPSFCEDIRIFCSVETRPVVTIAEGTIRAQGVPVPEAGPAALALAGLVPWAARRRGVGRPRFRGHLR